MRTIIMRTIIMRTIIIIIALAFILSLGTATATPVTPNIVIDGKNVPFPDAKPFINKDNRTLTPIRFVVETVGYKVDWDGQNRIVTIQGDKNIKLKIGEKKAIVDGKAVEMDTVAELIDGRTFVPLRFIVETLGGQVEWKKGTVFMSLMKNDKPEINFGDKKSLNQEYFGFNTNILGGPSWNDNNFLNIIKELNPQIIRYPGGTSANYWDWKTGWFVDNVPKDAPNGFSNLKMTFSSSLDEFGEMARETGITPIYVLNMETSNLEYQLQMLRHANSIGLPVKYVELGNEFYFGETRGQRERYPTSEEYAIASVRWAKEIKKEFPDAKIAVLGFTENPRREVGGRQKYWNSGMKDIIENSPYIDAVTLHPYIGPTERVDNQMFDYTSTVLADIQQTKKSLPDNKEIWITEYNIAGKSGDVIATWRHGLIIGDMTLNFLEDEDITMSLYHSLIGRADFTSFFKDEFGLRTLNENYRTEQFSLSATGFTLKELFSVMNEMKYYEEIKLNNISSNLVGYRFGNSFGQTKSIIINLSEQSFSIDFNNVQLGNDRMHKEHYANPTSIIMSATKDITTVERKITNSLDIKPYSINVFY